MELTAAEAGGAPDRLDPLFEQYLEAEYVDRHDPGRHMAIDDEIHASGIAKCQRQRAWKHERGAKPEASPYFELGDDFENIYGRALREHFGDKRVRQDVGCTIFVPADNEQGYIRIVGESDWTVFKHEASGHGHVVYDMVANGSPRYMKSSYDEEKRGYPHRDDLSEWSPYDGCIDRVIETKTTKLLKWLDDYQKRGFNPVHRYQLATYQQAFDAPGELTYMTRNEMDERRYWFDLEPAVWVEVVRRAIAHYKNRTTDTIPAADPMHDAGTCERFCNYYEECKKIGGEQWD